MKNRIKLKTFKKAAFYIVTRLMLFFILSLPAQALHAEGILNKITELVTDDIANPKAGLSSHPATIATEIIANENLNNANEINAIVASKHHPYLSLPNIQNRTEDLATLYKMAGYQLLWLGSPQARINITEVLNLLNGASASGLNAKNYDGDTLYQKLPSALKLANDNYRQLALYDTAISLSLLRFLHDLHYGRVNPQGINYNLKLREKRIDLPALIKSHLAQRTISQLPLAVEPKLHQYQKLKLALATYRQLAQKLPPFVLFTSKSINPEDNIPQIEELRRFLIAVGDLPEENAVTEANKSLRYTGNIVTAVKRFQQRHGLNPDGSIGKGTVAALNVPLSQRIVQIELAMERLRWLPELSPGPLIIVNIPAFELWAFENIGNASSNITDMKVVVGKAMKNETPVLMAELSFIDFMPYWNLPHSIVKKEILPKLMANPNYLNTEDMELVTAFGNETKAVAFTGSSIAALKQGALKVRQRPGKKNALGKVKFIFPNKEDVYLHDTPAQTLFDKSRRDFSHGCVRVDNPKSLAEFALKDQWSEEMIERALQNPKTQRVILKKPIPVLFFYVTAFFDRYNNLAFYPDIYGQDHVLLEALRKPESLPDQSISVSSRIAPTIKNN
ncbi:MAG: L,D-transpeptidase family protein [Methylococcales bacterium]|nr:L,D-transpeptidase family protein [Methylococcales bacterium]